MPMDVYTNSSSAVCNRKACTRGSSTAEANLAFLHGGWWLPHSPRRAIRLSCLSVAGPNDNSFLTWQRLCMEDPQCGENQEPQKSLRTVVFMKSWVLSCMVPKWLWLPGSPASWSPRFCRSLHLYHAGNEQTTHISWKGRKVKQLGELKSRKWVTDTSLPDRIMVVRKIWILFFKRCKEI